MISKPAHVKLVREADPNRRPSVPKTDALPDCATPRRAIGLPRISLGSVGSRETIAESVRAPMVAWNVNTGRHLVEHHPETEDVGRSVTLQTLRLFGRHVSHADHRYRRPSSVAVRSCTSGS